VHAPHLLHHGCGSEATLSGRRCLQRQTRTRGHCFNGVTLCLDTEVLAAARARDAIAAVWTAWFVDGDRHTLPMNSAMQAASNARFQLQRERGSRRATCASRLALLTLHCSRDVRPNDR
jgi:hypothetical protein